MTTSDTDDRDLPPDPDRLRAEAIQRVRQWVNDRERQRREDRRRRKYGRHGRRTIEMELEE